MIQILKMSKKILIFAVIFSIALSMTITPEAHALTKAITGIRSHTTASLDPSKVCGNHVCAPGESSKWFHAVSISQYDRSEKAKGGYFGQVIMHQLVVNTLAKNSKAGSSTSYSGQMQPPSTIKNTNSTDSK
jgi:hypothetical protein